MLNDKNNVLSAFSKTPTDLLEYLNQTSMRTSFSAFSLLGSLLERKVNYEMGLEAFFKDLFYVKNFGFLDYICEPYQSWIRQSILFLYKQDCFCRHHQAASTFKASFQYLLWSDVQERKVLVGHTIEPVLAYEKTGARTVINWMHFCSLKKEFREGDIIPFLPELYFDHSRNLAMEEALLENLAITFGRQQKAAFFSKKELKIVGVLADHPFGYVQRKVQSHERDLISKGQQLFGMDFRSAVELAAFMRKMRFV